MKKVMKIFLGAGFGAAFVIMSAAVALAHTALIDSFPAPGEVLDKSPSEVRLIFNESLGSGSSFEIFGENFKKVEGISPEVDPATPSEMIASIPPLQARTYTLQWTAISADGHSVTGSFSFSISLSTNQLDIKSIWWIFPVGILISGGLAFGIIRGLQKSS
jgi:methionine-rich copper-binding protein CopC